MLRPQLSPGNDPFGPTNHCLGPEKWGAEIGEYCSGPVQK
jgi:hypothetical protein